MENTISKFSWLLVGLFSAGILLPPANSFAASPQSKPASAGRPSIAMPAEIAHASGGIDGQIYTNSRQALDLNYAKGYRWFEVDLQLTSDHQMVLLHDWENAFVNLFGGPAGARSLDQFKSLRATGGYTQLVPDDVAAWTRDHPDSYIVLDMKVDPIGMLTSVKQHYPDIVPQLIPYVASANEYRQAKRLGFANVFWLIGEAAPSDEEVVSTLEAQPALAVAMPMSRAVTSLPRLLRAGGTGSYAWWINDEATRLALKGNYVTGVLSDFLDVFQPAPSAGTVAPGAPDRLYGQPVDSQALWDTPYNKFGETG